MATLVGSLLRTVTRGSEAPLNILSYPTHERIQSFQARTGHNFFLLQGEGIKDWKTAYAPLPNNVTLLDRDKGDRQIPLWLDLDIVLSQNKYAHFGSAVQYARRFHLPLISLEHCLPPPGTPPARLQQLKQMRGHENVFISDFSREAWGWGKDEATVIRHGIDTDVFSPCDCEDCQRWGIDTTPDMRDHCCCDRKYPTILSVVNDWRNRDWCCGFRLWQETTKDLKVSVVGDNPGMSKPAPSVEALVTQYRQAQVFLNTSLVSPVPTALMEAMACGCAVVSTCNCMIPEVVSHGVNGFLANTPQELREYCQMLLADEKLCRQLGNEARRTICEKFNLEQFVQGWNNVFVRAAQTVYRGE